MGMMVGANGVVVRTADPYGTQKNYNTGRTVQTTTNWKISALCPQKCG